MIPIYIKGLVIGFSIAAPVGPIGILCIRRTLAEGRLAGLLTGLGAASADAVYGVIAAGGLAAVSAFLVDQRDWLRLVGGIFLIFLGVRTLLAKAAEKPAESGGRTLATAWAATFFLTLTNPMTILSFIGIFAGLGLAESSGSMAGGALLVAGVFSGSALWWLILSGSVGFFKTHITPARLTIINRAAGVVIAAFGGFALLS